MADFLDDLEMIPAGEGDGATATDALDAAEAGLLEDPTAVPVVQDLPIPFGNTWSWDWDRGRFRRTGGAPSQVRGLLALNEWLQAMMRTAAGAHPIFTNFGIEDPEDFLGRADPTEAFADFQVRLKDGATEHDRIEDVTNLDADILREEGVIQIKNLDVVTDEGEYLRLGNAVVEPEII